MPVAKDKLIHNTHTHFDVSGDKATDKMSGLLLQGTVFYINIRVPVDLKAAYAPTTLIRKSLRTKDLQMAKRRKAEFEAIIRKEFEEKRAALPIPAAVASAPAPNKTKGSKRPSFELDNALFEEIITEYKRTKLQSDEAFRSTVSDHQLPEFNFHFAAENNKTELAKYKKALGRLDWRSMDNELDWFLKIRRFELKDPTAAQLKDLKLEMLRAAVEIAQVLTDRDNGDYKETDAVAPLPVVKKMDGKNIISLFELWNLEKVRDRKSVAAYHRTAQAFNAYVKGIPAAEISKEKVLNWVQSLVDGGASIKTVENKVVHISALFSIGISHGLLTFHPATKITAKGRPTVDIRPYSTAELEKVLLPLFSNRKLTDAQRWIPAIAYASGARLREISQIQLSNIFEEEGVWCIRLTDSGEGQQLKNKHSRRRFPIHQGLIDAGLLRFHKAQLERLKDPAAWLFPELKADAFGNRSAAFSKWYGRHKKRLGIIDRSLVFHSYRHLYKDLIRGVVPAIPEEVSDALTGHTNGSVSRKYGSEIYPLPPLVDAVTRIKLPVLLPVITLE